MTTTNTPPPTGQDGPRVTRDEIRDLGRLRRTTGTERNIAGVAGGLGRHLDVDPVVLRVALVVLALFGGAGLLLYGACWLLVPDDRSASAPLGLDDRSRSVGLVVAGALAAVALLGSSLGDGFVPFPLIVVAGVALLVVLQLNRRKAGTSPPGTAAAGTPSPVRVNPRKRGPILFWFTAALGAVGLGVLGVLDLAGAPIPDPAYPGLIVGLVGAMLVLGAFWGRAGGLILVGLVATVVLAGTVAAQEIDGDRFRTAPTSASAVRADYDVDSGSLLLDLRGVGDLAALDGRTVRIDGEVGRVEVLVPDGLDVTASARIDGPGRIDVFGSHDRGIDRGFTVGNTAVTVYDTPAEQAAAPPAPPALRLDVRLDAGLIEIESLGGTTR